MNNSRQRGAVTLEACISVLVFLVLMLLVSSLFVMFMAQNVTAHVVLQTSESLSLDVYAIESLMKEDGKIGTVSENLGQFITKLFGSSSDNPYFVTNNRWYNTAEAEDDTTEGNKAESGATGSKATELEQAIRTRFIGYLTGGDEVEADAMLSRMNVVDGLSGLDFSGSYVANDTLYIVLRYELEYDFDIWGMETVLVEQNTCSKLWKTTPVYPSTGSSGAGGGSLGGGGRGGGGGGGSR